MKNSEDDGEYLETTADKFTFRVKRGLLYSADEIWVAREGERLRLGVTDYLRQKSGDSLRETANGSALSAKRNAVSLRAVGEKSLLLLCVPNGDSVLAGASATRALAVATLIGDFVPGALLRDGRDVEERFIRERAPNRKSFGVGFLVGSSERAGFDNLADDLNCDLLARVCGYCYHSG